MNKKYIAVSVISAALMGLATLALGETISPSPSVSPSVSVRPHKTVDLACMQTAVGTRDDAIMAGVDAYHTSVSAALSARKSALMAAWGLTDVKARRAGLYTAWSNYRVSLRLAVKTLKTAKGSAWKKFYTDRRACGTTGASDDKGTAGDDAQL